MEDLVLINMSYTVHIALLLVAAKFQIWTVTFLVLMVSFGSVRSRRPAIRRQRLNLCNTCSGSRHGTSNFSVGPSGLGIPDNIGSSLLEKLSQMRTAMSLVYHLYNQSINPRRVTNDVIAVVNVPIDDRVYASPSAKVYRLISEIAVFNRLVLSPYTNRHGFCLHRYWNQSDATTALCYLKRIMDHENIRLPNYACTVNTRVHLALDSTSLANVVSSQIVTFYNKSMEAHNLLYEAEEEWQ